MNIIQGISFALAIFCLLFVFYKRAWDNPVVYFIAVVLFLLTLIRFVEIMNQDERISRQEQTVSLSD